MPLEVRCPQCRSVLKAPDAAAGKKAKCKKCGTALIVPGPAAAAAADAEAIGLSVADSSGIRTIDPASIPVGDPFSFDPPAPGGRAPAKDPSTPKAKAPAAPVSPAAFSFEAPPAGPVGVRDATPVPKDKSKSRHKYSSRALQTAPAEAAAGGGAKKYVLIGGLALACAAGGAAAAVFVLGGPNAVETKPAAAVAEKPADKPAEEPKKDRAKAAPKAKEQDAAAATDKAPAADEPVAKTMAAAPRAARSVTLTGGLVLPPAPPGAAVVQKAKIQFPVAVDSRTVRRILFSSSDAQVVAFVTPGFAGFQGRGAKDVLERYSTVSGKLVDRFEFDADGVTWPRAIDLGPGGDQLAAESPAGRITVWDVGGKAKLLDGVDPYPDAAGAKPGIAGLFLADDGKLAVVGTHGAVDVWDVRGKARTVAGAPAGKPGTKLTPAGCALTPDRKAVLVYADGAVFEVPLGTGKPKPGLTLPRKPKADAPCFCLAADPAGTRVAVAYTATEPAPHTLVAVGRLGEAKDPAVFFLDPKAGRPLAAGWPAQETLVLTFDALNAAAAFDTEAHKLVAVLHPAGGTGPHLIGQATGQHAALVSAAGGDRTKTVFTVVPFPHDGYLGDRDEKAPAAYVLTPDGLAK